MKVYEGDILTVNQNNTNKSDSAKHKLAEAVKECMRTTAAENVTVKQIVETCGVSRQTFYRNFIDKYDLINWYFDRLLEESFNQMGSGETLREGLIKKFRYIKEECVFFQAAFKVDEQNNLKEHDFYMIFEFYCRLIRKKTGNIPDKKIRKLLEMYCQSSIYMTVQWVLKGMKESEEELADLMIAAMPGLLEKEFKTIRII